ncbi:MAG: peptidylprolyl isomerase [Oscillospiraceae bacterium]
MSASQDKRKRQEERETGIDRRSLAEKKEAEERRKSKIKWTFVSVLVAILVAFVLIVNSGLFYSVLPSVTIGDTGYTNGQYQYYYYNSYYTFCKNYESVLSLFFDTQKPLNTQTFDPTYLAMIGEPIPESIANLKEGETATWADYFRETALRGMVSTTALYEKAVAEGYVLSDEDKAAIDKEISAMPEYAKSYNYNSVKKYISAIYGRGCNEKAIRRAMEMQYIAADYSGDNFDSYTYTPEELAAWYTENKDTYDTFEYLTYFVAADTVEVTEDVTDSATGETTQETKEKTTPETMAAAKTAAEALAAAATDADSFKAAVAELETDATVSENLRTMGGSLPETYSKWMLDAARASGDVTVTESTDTGYTVVMFIGRGVNDYQTAAFRHVLIRATDSDEDGEISDKEIDAAKKTAEELYSQWKSGDTTEDSFAALAKENSTDGGSKENGGLYENVAMGQMVGSVNDFIYADGRMPGDSAVVFNKDSNYTGYHIMYFVGYGDRYCDYLADSNLRNTAATEWMKTQLEGYASDTNLVFKFAAK